MPFWIEIWVSTPDTTALGVAQATVDLQYNTAYLTATEIQYGPAFTQNQTGTIDDALGVVTAVGGATALTDVGDDAYVLLARVRFASTGSDQVPVDEVGRNIGPYAMQLTLADGQTQLVGGGAAVPDLAPPPPTELWAVMYDIDDNNLIDFGDLSYFAPAFGRSVGLPSSEPPYTWWADFDKSGLVDFGDLSFFAPNFAKGRASGQAIVFPPNFPAGWAGDAGEGEALGVAVVLRAQDQQAQQDPRVDVQLVAVTVPTGSSAAAVLPDSITQIDVGGEFFIEIWVQDISVGTGVTGGYVTLSNTTAATEARALDHGGVFTMFADGTINNAQSQVENFGGGTLTAGLGVSPNWARLGYVQYAATAAGAIVLELAPGDLQFSLFGLGNVLDDDVNFGTRTLAALPELSIGGAAQAEGHAGTAEFEFTVSLSHASNQVVTVTYATQDGTATVTDNDYLGTSETLTFQPGERQKGITVRVNGDLTIEDDETFFVGLSSPSGARIAAGTGTGTILNDDLWTNEHPWHNSVRPCDVTDDGLITPLDALVNINEINSGGEQALPVPPQPPHGPPPYRDVSGDDWLTAIDVLLVINYINADTAGLTLGAWAALPSAGAVSGVGVNGEGEAALKDSGGSVPRRGLGDGELLGTGVLPSRPLLATGSVASGEVLNHGTRHTPWTELPHRVCGLRSGDARVAAADCVFAQIGRQQSASADRLAHREEPLEDVFSLLSEGDSDDWPGSQQFLDRPLTRCEAD